MHVLVVESGILDHNATVGVTHAFPLTLTPVAAMNQNTLWWQWILGPECSCRCGARVPLRFDPNRYDELKTLFLAVANGILDQNAPVGVTRAFPLTLTPIVAMSPKCCFCCGEWNLGPQCSCRCDTRDAALNQTCCFLWWRMERWTTVLL